MIGGHENAGKHGARGRTEGSRRDGPRILYAGPQGVVHHRAPRRFQRRQPPGEEPADDLSSRRWARVFQSLRRASRLPVLQVQRHTNEARRGLRPPCSGPLAALRASEPPASLFAAAGRLSHLDGVQGAGGHRVCALPRDDRPRVQREVDALLVRAPASSPSPQFAPAGLVRRLAEALALLSLARVREGSTWGRPTRSPWTSC